MDTEFINLQVERELSNFIRKNIMAHFAQLDENNIVIQVITAGDEYEETGEELYARIAGGVWKRTSYNTLMGSHMLGGTPFRKNYAGVGYLYDESRDAFIPPKTYDSWVFNEETCVWDAPIQYPSDGGEYYWDESVLNWIPIPIQQEI
jgi:hypothetical protein